MEQAFTSMAASGGLNSFFSNSASATSLQRGATTLSMLSSITAGRVARRESQNAASMSFFAGNFARSQGELDARQQEIEGRARAAQLQEELAMTIGGQQVSFAASGVDPSQGTAARIADQTARRGAEDLALLRSNTALGVLQTRLRASVDGMTSDAQGRAQLSQGRARELSSWMDAANTYADYRVSVAKRK